MTLEQYKDTIAWLVEAIRLKVCDDLGLDITDATLMLRNPSKPGNCILITTEDDPAGAVSDAASLPELKSKSFSRKSNIQNRYSRTSEW